MRKCAVCLERPRFNTETVVCAPCDVSYAKNDGWTLEWAAKRARYYERRRARKEKGT